jgi:hypothetical protein
MGFQKKGTGQLRVNKYHWSLFRDVCSIILEIPETHKYRKLGFLYLQIYPSIKNQNETQTNFPLGEGDERCS